MKVSHIVGGVVVAGLVVVAVREILSANILAVIHDRRAAVNLPGASPWLVVPWFVEHTISCPDFGLQKRSVDS